jgi:hypothetical protein
MSYTGGRLQYPNVIRDVGVNIVYWMERVKRSLACQQLT